jgi:uncharacterized protein YbjT (DUF2867 family)
MNTNQILVTGGTGSLGSRVVDRLTEAGENVRVMSRYRRADTILGDLLTGEGLEEAVEGVNTIVHCASSSLRKTRQVDVDGTRRLLRAAERAGVSHLVFISIVGVERNPYFPYYRMKLETERIIEHSEGRAAHLAGLRDAAPRLPYRTERPFLCPLQRGATGRIGAGGPAPALVALLRRATRPEECSREYHTPRPLGRTTNTARK